MQSVIVFLLPLASGLLILTPAIGVWRSLSRQAPGSGGWSGVALWVPGPCISVYALVVLLWLPAYSGKCGGWLGETEECGFGKYVGETMYWAAMMLAVPGVIGIFLGFAVLAIGLFKRGMSRPAI